MYAVILVTLHCLRLKLLHIFVVSLFGYALCRRSLGVGQTARCPSVQLRGRLDDTRFRLKCCSSMSILLQLENGVVCV